jgi:hypothetical protein
VTSRDWTRASTVKAERGAAELRRRSLPRGNSLIGTQRLRDQEFIRFLNAIEKKVPTKKSPRHPRRLCRSQTSQVITYPRVTYFTSTSALMAERS